MPSARTLIDWHSHVWLLDHFPPEALVERRTKPGLGDAARGAPALHRDAMQAVDRYVIVGLQLPWIHIPNDFVAEQVAASNGRAIGFASVDPHRPDALVEFQRAVSVLGLRGLKLSPVYQGFDPRMDKAWALYELADRLQVPVMFHVGGANPASATLEHGNPVLLDPIARAFPGLRIIVAHLGQPNMAETVMLLRKHRNVFADLSARFHRPWQLYNGLVVALEYGVWDKLLFGSDFPVRTPAETIELFRGLRDMVKGTNLPQITDHMIDSVLYERPLSLLGL
jgi:predicted TIM-barrel fold metal-dependent hydrolase